MQSKGVLVYVEHPSLGSAKGSGLLINNVVIAHGSLLLPLCLFKNDSKDVKKIYNSLLKELEGNQCFLNIPRTAEKFRTQPFKFKIHQDVSPLRINQKLRTSCASTRDVDSSVHENTLTEEVTMCQIHYYKGFSRIIEEISNWTLIDKDKEIDDEQSLYSVVLPTFFLLMVGEPCKNTFENTLQALFKTSQNINFHPGTPVLIESTPFGNYSFMSAWSRGIISKIVGCENDGFLTDTRLVYGCEGAPVYTFQDGAKSVLLGLILHTISWCNGEWVGFSLGISINYLLKSILEKSSTVDLSRKYVDSSLKFNQINMDYLSSAVVFVRCAHKWGSGVVVDSSQGLILTCAHVIEHYPEPVKVICKQGQFKASVLFSSPLNEPYDLAVLSVGKVTGLKHLTFADKPAVLGETVFTAGYPLSTESLVKMNTTPTLSSGYVSKISTRGGPLQTTCCTQSGVSGGALFRPPDQLLGIVVSNVRVDKTVLPSFGIAVSVEDFKEPVIQYLRMGDQSSLQSLHVKSYKVKMDWELRDSKL